MIFAKQSTAIIVTVGPVLDADGVAVTGGVVGDFKISKNGGAPAALDASATLTHRHTGFYSLSLTATDVNTVGTAEVVIDDTVNACPMKEIQVVEGTTYDALFADSAPGPATPTNITAGTVTTATNVTTVNGLAAGVITAASIATGAIDADSLAADAGTEIGTAVWATATRSLTVLNEDSTTLDLDATIRAAVGLAAADLDTQLAALPTAAENADAVWDEDATGHQTGGTFGQAIGDPAADTNTIYGAVVTGAAGATIAADIIAVKAETASILEDTGTTLDGKIDTIDGIVDAILLDTAEIGAAGAGLTALATQASVNTIDDFLDTEIAAIKAKTDNLPAAPAATGDAMALTAAAVDAILDDAADGSLTVRQLIRGFAAALLGKASGLATTTAVYRDANDTKDRITATVDADGNRTAVTLDLT